MDPWGRKMSKSLGNGIDADSVLECGAGGRTGSWKVKGPNKTVNLKANKIGSECFRLWKACDAQVGDDFQINPEEIEAKYYGVLTKLFNVARFASQFEIPNDLDSAPSDLSISERWILSEFSQVNLTVRSAWENIDIYTAAQAMKNFGTGVFPSHWLEMAKTRLYNDDLGAAWTVHRIVRDLLTMFSPICPFLCHHLSSTLYGVSAVDIREFPELPISELGDGELGEKLRQYSPIITEFNSDVWAAKNEAGLGRGKPISGIEIPPELEEFSNHLITMHKLE